MTRHDPQLALRHMLEHAREARDMAQDAQRRDLDRKRQLELSLVRLLEIVGEAATRVPDKVRACYPEVPWPEIVNMRNRLIHGYDAVDLDIVWAVVKDDLPPLIAVLEAGGDDPS